MRAHNAFAPLLLCALLLGCSNDDVETKQPSIPRGKPAFVRFVNLTGTPAIVNAGPTITDVPLEGYAMSTATPYSPKKKVVATVKIGGNSLSGEFATESGKFTTIMLAATKLDSFISGDPLSTNDGAKVDLMNLTDKPAVFVAGGIEQQVKPNDSITVAAQDGEFTVKTASGESAVLTVGSTQVWAAFVLKANGKTLLKSKSLKGDGKAVGLGASP